MNKNYTLSFTVTGDGKLAVKSLKEVDDQARKTAKATADAMKATDGASKQAATAVAAVGDAMEKAGAKAKGAGKSVGDSLKPVPEQAKKATDSLDLLGTSMLRLASIAGPVAILRYLQQAADNAVLAEARIKLVTSSLTEQQAVQVELLSIANQQKVSYDTAVSSFLRIQRATQEYGGTTREAIDLTRIFTQTLRISGATQQEAAATAIQFGQAMSSGRLQGDELRSILEGNARFAVALAEGLGVSVGELKKLGEEGQLTSQKVAAALLSQQKKLQQESTAIANTISGSWRVFTNELDQALVASGALTASQKLLASSIELVAEGMAAYRKNGGDMLLMAASFGQMRFTPDFVMKLPDAATQNRQGTGDPLAGQETAEERAKKARQAAERLFRDAVQEAGGAEEVYAKFDAQLRKVALAYEALTKAGGANAEQQRTYNAEVSQIIKNRAEALEALSKKGSVAFSTEVSEIKKLSELRRAAADQQFKLEADAINRVQGALDFYHQAGLMKERDYLDRRGELREGAARVEYSRAKTALQREQELLLAIQNKPARDKTEQKQKDGEIADQRRKIKEVTTDLTIAERALADASRKRGDDMYLADLKLLEQLTAIDRERADFIRGMKAENEETQFQIELLNKSTTEQARMTAERQARRKVEEELLRIIREISELEAKGADPELIAARQRQREELERNKARMVQAAGDFAEQLASSGERKRIGDAVADAILDGGSDIGKNLWALIQDELKKPFKVAISNAVQSFLSGGSGGDLFGDIGRAFSQYMQGGGSSTGYFNQNEIDMGNTPTGPGFSMANIPPATIAAVMMAVGSAGGSALARGLGAGERGQRIASQVGMFTGILPGAIVGYFSDPDGLAERRADFGTDAAGRYSYSARSAFGTFGTSDDRWFSDDDMGDTMRSFLTGLAALENRLAARLTGDQRAAATAALAGEREYSFGEEHGDFSNSLANILRDRLAEIVEAAMPGQGERVRAFQGTSEELERMVDALFNLKDSVGALDDAMASLTGNSMDQFRRQVTALDTAVETAQSAFDVAIEGSDPAEILSAQQNLMQAVLNRYNTERQLIEQLGDQIEGLQQQAYDFSVSIAQRINAAGGSRDIGALAGARATSIRAGLGGISDPGRRVAAIQNYLGALDTWYEDRKAAIERDTANQVQAMSAQGQMQAAIAQARASALQTELDLAQQWVGVLGQARGQLDAMRYTAASPVSALGRLSLATGDVNARMADFRAMTGQGKLDAASKLLPLLQTRLGLLQEGFQRPSNEYSTGYNEIAAMLSEVEAFAQTQEEKALSLQQRIAEAQDMANSYAAQSYDASLASNALLEELNAQYIEQAEWAEADGLAAYEQAERLAREQRDAITGGMEVDLYLASLQRDSRDLLQEIRDAILAQTSGTATGSGAGTTGGAGSGTGTGGTGGGDVIIGDIIVPTNGGRINEQDIINAVVKAAPYLKRALANV